MAVEPRAEHFLFVDIPRLADGQTPVRVSDSLSVIGWAHAAAGVDSIALAVDGRQVIDARYGLRRPDVAAAHPQLPEALLSGYMAQLPPKALPPGEHRVTVTLRDNQGAATSADFRVVVEPTTAVVRRKMPLAELRLKQTLLPKKRLRFTVVLKLPREDISQARKTLESLDRQVYGSWRLCVLSTTRRPRELHAALVADSPHLAERITVSARLPPQKPRSDERLLQLTPGEELGCDALLERALAARRPPETDIFTPVGVQCLYPSRPLFEPDSLKNILVVKLDHLGDAVAALAAVNRLKHHFPRARLTILSAHAALRLWQAQPAVADVIEFNFFHERSSAGRLEVSDNGWQQLSRRLQAGRFDLAVDLRKQPDTRQVLRFSDAPLLAGFEFQGRFPWLDIALEWDEDVPLRDKRSHVSDDLVALVERIHLQSSAVPRVQLNAPTKASLPLTKPERRWLSSRPYLCVHPSAGSPMRQWPAEKFAQLIDLVVAQHGLTAVLVGSAADQLVSARVIRSVTDRSSVLDLTGRLQLEQLQTLLARAALFVGNNSGPQHIAAALGVFTIGVYSGVVDAREWAPTGARAVAVRRDMWCSPCYLERPEDCPRSLACLTELEATEVYRVCRDWFASCVPAVPLPPRHDR